MFASIEGHVEVVKVLLVNNASVDKQNKVSIYHIFVYMYIYVFLCECIPVRERYLDTK